MSQQLCACGGKNPGCFRCFGSGIVKTRAASQTKLATDRPVGTLRAAFADKSALSQCPECGVRVKKLERHMRKMHGPGGPPSPPARTRCPECGSEVNVSNLEQHIRRVHGSPGAPRPLKNRDLREAKGKKRKKRKSRSPSGTRSAREAGTGKDRNAESVASRQHEPDATKDYAHAFREGGRFGSHPAHDDFSDEGRP